MQLRVRKELQAQGDTAVTPGKNMKMTRFL